MFVSSINQTIDSEHVSGARMIISKQNSFRVKKIKDFIEDKKLLQRESEDQSETNLSKKKT